MGDLDFSRQVVVVIGGSGVIGNALARAFAARGAVVTIWGRRAAAGDYASDPEVDLDGLQYRSVDVTDTEAVSGAMAEFTRIDVLVVSHGLNLNDGEEYKPEGFARVVTANLTAAYACAAAAEQALANARGTLIFVSSRAAVRPSANFPGYSAAKAGIENLVRLLAVRWGSAGIRVNAISPGFVATRMTEGISKAYPGLVEKHVAAVPLGRNGKPEDMAGAALFLSSPLASFVTGQILVIDGGSVLV